MSAGSERRSVAMRNLVFFLSLLAIFMISLLNHYAATGRVAYYGDEHDWLTRSYFFRLACIDRNVDHFLWQDVDGIDQPHGTDFAIALGLLAARQPLPQVPIESRSWRNGIAPFGERLRAARFPCALLGSLVAPLLFVIATVAWKHLGAGIVAGLLYAVHPLAVESQSRAMSDGPTVFTSVLVITLLLLFFRDNPLFGHRPRTSPARLACLLACAAAAGLAIGTKLTGLMVANCPIIAMLIAALREVVLRGAGWQRRTALWSAHLALFVVAAILCTVAVNPTLYRSPASRLRQMLNHRWATAKTQQQVFSDVALLKPTDRVDQFFRVVLFSHLEVDNATFRMLHLNLATIGLCGLILAQVRSGRNPERWARLLPLTVWITVVAVVMTPLVLLNWPRYYLLHVTCWELLTGLGFAVVFDFANAQCRAIFSKSPSVTSSFTHPPNAHVS